MCDNKLTFSPQTNYWCGYEVLCPAEVTEKGEIDPDSDYYCCKNRILPSEKTAVLRQIGGGQWTKRAPRPFCWSHPIGMLLHWIFCAVPQVINTGLSLFLSQPPLMCESRFNDSFGRRGSSYFASLIAIHQRARHFWQELPPKIPQHWWHSIKKWSILVIADISGASILHAWASPLWWIEAKKLIAGSGDIFTHTHTWNTVAQKREGEWERVETWNKRLLRTKAKIQLARFVRTHVTSPGDMFCSREFH